MLIYFIDGQHFTVKNTLENVQVNVDVISVKTMVNFKPLTQFYVYTAYLYSF